MDGQQCKVVERQLLTDRERKVLEDWKAFHGC
jgi:hypothetical protein